MSQFVPPNLSEWRNGKPWSVSFGLEVGTGLSLSRQGSVVSGHVDLASARQASLLVAERVVVRRRLNWLVLLSPLDLLSVCSAN